MDVCHFIQDLKVNGVLPIEMEDLYNKANKVERAYSKLGIISHIDEATGYIKYKRQKEYQELIQKFLTEEPEEWREFFDKEFWDILWDLWLKKYNLPEIKDLHFLEILLGNLYIIL